MDNSELELLSSVRCFDGQQNRYSHWSQVNQCTMTFSVYLPPGLSESNPMPVVYWLSGLTCTDENFVQKAGAQRYAAELGLILVAPDTSPRGENIPDDPEGNSDLGLGAGFYVDATQTPWSEHYSMFSYVSDELPNIIENTFPTNAQSAISGHSMGGHGALIAALKNPEQYSSVSAFAPIVNPLRCPWGQKAFSHYLGEDKSSWNDYDACELIAAHNLKLPLLVDQGDKDTFLSEQLLTKNLAQALKHSTEDWNINLIPGYDHSYFFIASFIEKHLKFHKKHFAE